jgi:beta-glucosidase
MPQPELRFPAGFVFGAATAAYQIEGHTRADGRGESIWDRFATIPGAIEEGVSGEGACDHYARWESDIDLMLELGLQAYRYSIAWPRVIPTGRGPVNAKGLDFYERLTDRLLAKGIRPSITLYHWDLPQSLEDEGGWAARSTAEAFGDYAAAVAKRLGDRPVQWATFNEPWCVANLGYKVGNQAPGRKETEKTVNQVIHHILLAHGMGAQALRRHAPQGQVGIVIVPAIPLPWRDTPADREAAEQLWALENDWWLEPLFHGRYPQAVWDWKGADAPEVQPGDLELIGQKLDWLGLNFYFPTRVTAEGGRPYQPVIVKPEGVPTTEMPGWEVDPTIAEHVLTQFSRRYPRLPFYVTENGAAFDDPEPDAQGRVRDPKRLDYIREHLRYGLKAVEKGVDLKGWFVWSLMDNFEWRFGYKKRFGIVRTDYGTYQRTVKDSGRWYAELIRSQGA